MRCGNRENVPVDTLFYHTKWKRDGTEEDNLFSVSMVHASDR